MYGVDILDLGGPRLSWRRLRSLVERLPVTSRTARAQHGETSSWGTVEHLLAGIVDRLEIGNWQRANAGVKKPNQTRPPKPMPRPGDPTGRTRLTPQQIRDRLHNQRRRMPAATRQGGDPWPSRSPQRTSRSSPR